MFQAGTWRSIASSKLMIREFNSFSTLQLQQWKQSSWPINVFKKQPLPIDFENINCENNHITWPKKDFSELLTEEVKRISVLSVGGSRLKSHEKIQNDFKQLVAGLERLISLQTWDEVDATANKFKDIDPDRVKVRPEREEKNIPTAGESLMKQKDFLKLMTPYLKQAGFSEIGENIVKDLLLTHHRYGDVELKVEFDEFDFIRVWVFGKSGNSLQAGERAAENRWSMVGRKKRYESGSETCHRRVVIAAKSKKSDNMIFKCFKDVPVGHFEALIPQARINIPFKQKWFWNVFLFGSGVTFFFNIGLWLQSEHKLGFLLVSAVVMSFVVYRTRVIYRNVRNRYSILWKEMLYYKSTSNNSALVMEILNRARGQNFKKTVLAYVAALQVANRNKGKSVTTEEITGQCTAWFRKVECDYPDRAVGAIDYGVGISNLLNVGILSYASNGQGFDVAGVATALESVREELLSLCTEICDST